MRHSIILSALLLASLPAIQVRASEKDELALVMRQLDQVQACLDRARVVANQNQEARFYFDYQQASRDIATMKQGISTYLEPSRAQPSVPVAVTGQYRAEEPDWQ
ncbi:integrative conjugative element protein, RAQPRD family [Salmonella enterica]|uniref:Integrative conjugative element protein, RAQPRD family n=2 Tax=Salmonella enterica TaxID=28901 RepID=F2Q937_SALET|nr:RAQPRD family integrative conjugative element protein [Salmonella enterica]CAX68133.1 putative exported protein [Salmonella enterica subsp. enterica] [Salmonella enterica subsp. enterica serovar Senftenberg]HAB1649554.1 integrative conjugative element protein, RAQPRD family [Salmonella enterica subsp. enterica]EBY8685111.1 integrative conjugative element protein, RAQPRD family [Salmonella enterica subsp. enterica serovar Agona]EHW1978134.1 integrative conjugative element protein, RAQPRD fami